MCGMGEMLPEITGKYFSVDGQRIWVPGIIVRRCCRCLERVWSSREIERAQSVAAIKAKKAA